jgi:hypothetical protein
MPWKSPKIQTCFYKCEKYKEVSTKHSQIMTKTWRTTSHKSLETLGQNVGSKHHPNWVPNTPSESSWILNIEKKIAFIIWSYKLKVALEDKMLFASNFCN